MIPFFAGAALPGYQAPRPLWALAALWPLWLLHAWLELRHGYAWLWLPDLPIAALTAWLLWLWWPRQSSDACVAARAVHRFRLAADRLRSLRGAEHLVCDDRRVHSRPCAGARAVHRLLRQPAGRDGHARDSGALRSAAGARRTAGFAFVVVQAVAVLRVLAELLPDSLAWQAIAGAGWIVAFLPWVLRSAGSISRRGPTDSLARLDARVLSADQGRAHRGGHGERRCCSCCAAAAVQLGARGRWRRRCAI